MDSPPEPRSGQLYRTPDGVPAVFVRTERRPGAAGPEHFYVTVRGREIWHRWSVEPLAELELIHDPEATAHAEGVERDMAEVRAEREALLQVIRKALPLVPVVTANAMRAAYREAMGGRS